MKGIILAGGSGTRLYPLTKYTSKQALPVYDKPMIYYPLSTLMLAGIRDILIISTPRDLSTFKNMLGDGSNFGIRLSYAEQPSPDGLAQAFIIGEDFIGKDKCAMILGDNIFHGNGLSSISIEEKPKKPKSNYAVAGLYIYDNKVVEYAKKIKPSERGELEITDINKLYLQEGQLHVKLLGRGYAWLDTGTIESLLEAAEFMSILEKRQGIKVCIPEEIAYKNGWISAKKLGEIISEYGKSNYGNYLRKVKEGRIRY